MIKQFHGKKTGSAACIIMCIVLFSMRDAVATTKVTAGSGDWDDSTTWSPAGVPGAGDNITINTGDAITISSDQSIHTLIVSAGGSVTWSSSSTLTLSGTLTVNGSVDMNGGNISLTLPAASFTLGAGSSFTWDPGTNISGAATLFTNGAENFSSTSTLTIKKWYNYAVPLGSVVTGNFGNLTMNSLSGTNIVEWNQNNSFQTHLIQGTLTVDQGWITLDKSGSISNTSIGNIVLASVNSSLYCHNGTHNSAFTVTTNSITNNGGNFYGLNDGNGNVAITVNGNFTNIGNIKIINNTGVSGVSNGNATFTVTGTFSQSTGDTRIIYNIATLNSGIFTATFGTLTLNGGIFMGQTACHSSGGTSTISVTNNFTINFSNAADKFRGASLSSIGASVNNVKLLLTVGGNLSISGTTSAEFTSTASSGSETIGITGNVLINGATASFNYGTAASGHNLSLTIGGTFTIAGGTTYLSHNGGTSTINITGNTVISSGSLSVKGDTGIANIVFSGTFNQSGGNFYLHNNTPAYTPNPITMTVSRSFTQSAGTINLDNNSSSQSAVHTINFAGQNYNLSGNGMITHAAAGTGSVFGLINFSRAGTINYSRTSSSHFVQQVKQTVANGCTLNLLSGNIQVCSHATPGTDYFEITNGGTVVANSGQFVSGALATFAGLQVDSGGTLKIAKTQGLYDGTTNACISSANNFNFYLHPYSVVEYNGTDNQVITGTGNGLAVTTNHKYGILRINFTGTPNTEYVAPAGANVFIKTQLDLVNGEMNLNGNRVTVESGMPSAITRTNGYIKSEVNSATNSSVLAWQNMSAGVHEFPFGTDAATYIPVDFSPTAGFGGEVSIATRATTPDNQPCSASPALSSASLTINDVNIADSKVVDRWWDITAYGFTADVTLTYCGSENTLLPDHCCGPMGIIAWDNAWSQPFGLGTGTISSTGTITATDVTTFSNWVVVSNATPLPIELTSFDATINGSAVDIKWAMASEINVDFFDVERSVDGITFTSIAQVKGKGNTSTGSHYSVTDKEPLPGTSYYRLKQTNYDGKTRHSETRVVNFQSVINGSLTVKDFGPNPFDNSFWVNYEISKEGMVNFQLTTSEGRVIKSEEINATAGSNRYEYQNKTWLKAGAYLLNIRYNDKLTVKKFIKK